MFWNNLLKELLAIPLLISKTVSKNGTFWICYVRNSPTLSQFKHDHIQIIRPPKRSTFGIHDVEGLKLLTRLRVKFSDLSEHRFRHNFRFNSPNCLCGKWTENKEHFLLHCHWYGSPRRAFLDRVSSPVDFDIIAFCSSDLCNLLLYGDSRLNLVSS